MSFPYIVAARLRSVPTSEPADGTKCDGDDKIILNRDGDKEPKLLSKALPSISSQSDVWTAVGEPGYVAASESKQHSCVVVWGSRKSGKSFSCLGDDDGLVNRAIRQFAGSESANLTVTMVRNDQIYDLLQTKYDNVRVKVEDGPGLVFEGNSTVKLTSSDAGMDHVKKCLKNREELLKELNTEESMVFTCYVIGLGEGSFTIIDCCASDRFLLPEPTPEQKKENDIRIKTMKSFQSAMLEMAVNADSKAIGWKESKINRYIQSAGSQAMEGPKGFFALLVCVNPVKYASVETQLNITFAQGVMKQEGLKTVSEYKEMMSSYEERNEADGKEAPALQQNRTKAEQEMTRVKAENADKARELADKLEELKSLVPRTQAQVDADIDRLKKDLDKQKQEHEKYLAGETDRLMNLSKNKNQIIDENSKKAVSRVTADLVEQQNALKEQIKEADAELEKHKKIIAEADKLRAEVREKEKEALKPVKEAEKELSKLKKELEGAGKCREDGMEEDEIARMIPVWEARDELDDVDKEMMELAREVMMLDYIYERKFGKDESSSDDSDSDSDSSSESPSEKEAREQEEREEAEREAVAEKLRKEEAAFEKEHAFVKDAVYREKFLNDLVDKVMCYLEYGTNVAVLTSKGFSRHFLYMTRNRKQWALVAEVAEGQVPIKKDPVRVIPIEQVQVMHLGQHSSNFTTFLKKIPGRADPPRHEQPPPPEDLSPANMHRYYYRAFSLQMKRDAEEWLDIICDTQTDFEALVVAFNRLTGKECNWGRKMFIDLADKVDDLKPYERKLCEDLHLTPVQYFTAKEKVLADPEVLYMTLHDMRLLTTLDLYHCQCLMDVFLQQKWVAVRDLVYFKYWEDPERVAAEEASWGDGPAPGSGDDGEEEFGGGGDDEGGYDM